MVRRRVSSSIWARTPAGQAREVVPGTCGGHGLHCPLALSSPAKIRVNAVSPGPVQQTELLSACSRAIGEKIARLVPPGVGQPQEVADVVAFFCPMIPATTVRCCLRSAPHHDRLKKGGKVWISPR